jgi:hypothetical protein
MTDFEHEQEQERGEAIRSFRSARRARLFAGNNYLPHQV